MKSWFERPMTILITCFLVAVSCKSNTIETRVGDKEVERPELTNEVSEAPKIEVEYEAAQTEVDPFDPDVINGRWEADEQNGFSFDLRFYVEDGFIKGQYCAINETATRIDCGEMGDEACYVKGPLVRDGGAQIVEVKSCYSGKTGEAELYIVGDKLQWNLMVEPGKQGVDHFAPLEALLTKVHFDPFE